MASQQSKSGTTRGQASSASKISSLLNSTSPLIVEKDEQGIGSGKVKILPPSVIKDIEQKNVARKLAGLPIIGIRTRRCLTCGLLFQSSGNRTCGCSSRSAGIIAGREII